MSFEERGKKAIENIVKQWTQKYLYHITYLQKQGQQHQYMVEFSLPTPEKPIPISTVQVYFFLRQIGPSTPPSITYRFQKDSLVHTPSKSIRDSQMQKFLQSFLLKKQLTRQNVFYLGSEYELTRVKDARQDRILDKRVEKEQPEYVYIAPELLADQKRAIEIMERKELKEDWRKAMREQFVMVDKEGMGVVTLEQFTQVLRNMGLKLTAEEQEDLLNRADSKKTGLVDYREFSAIGKEIVKSLIVRNQTTAKLKQNEQEYELQSLMMLINQESHHIGERLLTKFKKVDEDEHGYIKLTDVKRVLEEVNHEQLEERKEQAKKLKKQNKPREKKQGKEGQKARDTKDKQPKAEPAPLQPILTAIQISQFTKRLSQKYLFDQVRYDGIQKELVEFKLQNLKKGLIESNLNNLEVYLREIFDPYDKDKFGKIHINDMLMAFMKSDKIVLTKGQRYVLRSIVDKDEKDMVSYIHSSKQIAELLKRFYLTSDQKRHSERVASILTD